MSSHIERLAARAAPLLERCVASDEFDEALLIRCRAAAIGAAAGADADHVAVGRACAEAADNGAAMADELLADLATDERDQLVSVLRAELAHRVQIACLAFFTTHLESTMDVGCVEDGADIPTLVAIGIGLGAVIA